MANKFRGEGTASANGVQYRLRFDMNVLADLESRFEGRKAIDILQDIDGANPSMATLREVCCAMLQRYHAGATLQDAGDLLSEDAAAVKAVISSSMPEPEAGAAPGNRRAKVGQRS